MRVYEIFVAELGTYVKFKVLDPTEVEKFAEEASEMERDDYIKHVLENVVYNMKSEIVDSLKVMSRRSGNETLDALFNGCVMLNPGLDIEKWVEISYSNLDRSNKIQNQPDLDDVDLPQFTKGTSPKKAKYKKLTKAKFLNLNGHLLQRVVGQPEAISEVVSALKRNQVGLNDENRPLGIFLFAGSSGVGKTYLARELHEYLYGNEYDIVRIDCGEFQHKHDNQKLLGAPPSYVGHEDGAYLINRMKEQPNTVLLLDEVEKAHPDIWNTFLRIFDEGMLTDNKGNDVSFRNTVIIMTTNLGNDKIVDSLTGKSMGFNGNVYEALTTKKLPKRSEVEKYAGEAIKKMFRPEFINRIDKTVIFNHLSPSDYYKIAELEIAIVQEKLSKKGIVLEYSTEVLLKLIEDGVDSIRGARGISHVRRDKIENLLADIIINSSRIVRGTLIELDVNDKEFTISVIAAKKKVTEAS